MSVNIIHTEFAAQLRQTGISQAAFARLCDVSVMAVNHWCRGRYPVPAWAWGMAHAVAKMPADTLVPVPALPWFEVLGVSPDADLKTASVARARLTKKYHPDVGGSTEAMQRVNAAFEMAKQLRK